MAECKTESEDKVIFLPHGHSFCDVVHNLRDELASCFSLSPKETSQFREELINLLSLSYTWYGHYGEATRQSPVGCRNNGTQHGLDKVAPACTDRNRE